jgi:tetratricopeptide (TPR) repeat protein
MLLYAEPVGRNAVMSKFSATDSVLGYLYQLRIGLLWALKRLREGNTFLVSVETLDDVAFESPIGIATDLLQTKLHRTRDATLTDASVDFWKTLRIWIAGRKEGSISRSAALQLLTTATASNGSIASHLRVENRNESAALAAMEQTALATANEKNAPAFAAFNDLTAEERRALVASIVVLDRAPDITTLDDDIKKEVFWAVDREELEIFLQRLEGWWFQRVLTQLNAGLKHRITSAEIETRMSGLRNEFKRDDSLTDDDLTRRIPSVSGIAPRPVLEKEILARLTSSSYVVLRGMRGAGKTVLAARVAHQLAQTFDVIWYDAIGLKKVEQLETVLITRRKRRQSIASLLRTERVLVVLDDPRLKLGDVPSIDCGEKARILVTTQTELDQHVIVVGDLDANDARAVLTDGVSTPCPDGLPERVQKVVGGHALTLRALNRVAATRGWNDVEDCVTRGDLDTLRDDYTQKILERILERHFTDISVELEFVAWCGTSHLHEDIADAVCRSTRSALHERGFLAATTPGYIRVHDLVYLAIDDSVRVSEQNNKRFRERLAAFVRRESETDRPLLQRMARVHEELFARLVSEQPQPEFVYMVATRRSRVDAITLLGDPVAAAAQLAKLSSLAGRTLEIRAVIEVVEALYTLRHTHKLKEEARAKLEGEIQALTSLLAHPGLTSEQRTMLEYHRAKMLPRLDDKGEVRGRDEAITIFRALLEKDPSYTAARNQLAKILPPEGSILESERVVMQHDERPGSVSWNLVLDSFRLLIRHGADIAKHEGRIMRAIEYAKTVDFSESVRLVVAVGQRAWFNAPQVLQPMFNALSLTERAPNRSEAFDWAQVHKFSSMGSDAPSTQRELLAEAVRLYQLATLTHEYEFVHYANALVLACQYQKAIDVLGEVTEKKRSGFWWQRQAEALSGLDAHADAVAAIDRAIETIPEPSLLPDFYRSKFRIRRVAGHRNAIEELVHAIELLPQEHSFRKQLEAELATT